MRLGVLDVGSNTVHLQVVDTSPGARPNPTFNYKEELRLTQYISDDNQVSQEGIEKLRNSIKRIMLSFSQTCSDLSTSSCFYTFERCKNGRFSVYRAGER